MLTYPLDKRGDMSLYDYIYTCIKEDILAGIISPGEKLPSKRSFSKNLGVSVITVENAYSQLLAEGFLYSVEKKGYFAAEIKDFHVCECRSASQRDFENEDDLAKSAVPDIIADFASNVVNTEKFPFSQWSRITRNILSDARDELLMAAPVKGVAPLREAIADYLYKFRGLKVSGDRIVVGSGTEYLYGILIQLLGHDKIYAMEDPGYSKVSKILEGNRVKCYHVPIDKQGMVLDALHGTDANVVHLTPSHHFPSGIVMPIQRRLAFIKWALETDGRYIIEDDYDCEFRLQGRPIRTMFESDRNGRVIYMNTFSKTLAPSFRISYMVLPENLMQLFEKKLGYMACTVPNLEQYVLASFMSEGYFERHINRMRVYYRNRRDEILMAIRESGLHGRCRIHEEHAGLHFLLEVDTVLSDDELKKRAFSKGIIITCLSDYSYNESRDNEHIILLNYSGIKAGTIRESIRLLGDILNYDTSI
ncbi:MAG: PLP-dependent aminotransferase family protein [Lachnospiraceae bacterium]|nr:PLP-dependent aminotransferase family protein [Lachnospiraceae bacterium]